MHFAASEGDLAVRVVARVEILDLPEGFPAAMSLEERSSLGARAAGKKRTLEPDADMGLDDLETPAAKRITNSVFAEETAFGGPDFSRWHPGRRDSWSTEPPTPPPLDWTSTAPTPPRQSCALL